MRKTGFIGYGAMGSIMLKALLDKKALSQDCVIVFTRTPGKINGFTKGYPNVEIAGTLADLATKCERICICTGTAEVKTVLTEIVPHLQEDIHIITITAANDIKCLQSVFDGRITIIIPTQIAEVGEGVTLVCHNTKALPKDRKFINTVFGKIGRVKEVKESQISLASDLSSCAPAFYAAILNNFATMAQKHGDLTPEEIREIIIPTAYGTTKLFMEKNIEFTELITRVATPGGISEEGVKILDRTLPGVFDEILAVTLAKREATQKRMRQKWDVD
jgi:pyrroline-5-carboxylate reductase